MPCLFASAASALWLVAAAQSAPIPAPAPQRPASAPSAASPVAGRRFAGFEVLETGALRFDGTWKGPCRVKVSDGRRTESYELVGQRKEGCVLPAVAIPEALFGCPLALRNPGLEPTPFVYDERGRLTASAERVYEWDGLRTISKAKPRSMDKDEVTTARVVSGELEIWLFTSTLLGGLRDELRTGNLQLPVRNVHSEMGTEVSVTQLEYDASNRLVRLVDTYSDGARLTRELVYCDKRR